MGHQPPRIPRQFIPLDFLRKSVLQRPRAARLRLHRLRPNAGLKPGKSRKRSASSNRKANGFPSLSTEEHTHGNPQADRRRPQERPQGAQVHPSVAQVMATARQKAAARRNIKKAISARIHGRKSGRKSMR